jgi:hypothetical protein
MAGPRHGRLLHARMKNWHVVQQTGRPGFGMGTMANAKACLA